MHLASILDIRSIPAAGLYISLTRRCPLSCAHCSTSSTTQSEEQDGQALLRFVSTFSEKNRPQILMLTGGEPLLRPGLVKSLTDIAHSVGTMVSLSSSLFFASKKRIPETILDAILAVDHIITSLDTFHEREISRSDLLAIVSQIVALGKDVSFHVVGNGPNDPYLSDVVDDIRQTFKDNVPIIVGDIQPVGRAADWMTRSGVSNVIGLPEPTPCTLAAWPVVAFDGSVVLCCNQDAIDGPTPDHLKLGDVRGDAWEAIRARHISRGFHQALRVFGPQYLSARFKEASYACQGYCETCRTLSNDVDVSARIDEFGARPTMSLIQDHVVEALRKEPLQGVVPKYAYLAYLGAPLEQKGDTLCE